MTYSSRYTRRRAWGILISTFCLLLTTACQTTPTARKEMTVEEASQLALTFQGKYETPPPRGFGNYVKLYVDRYQTLKPGVIEKCSKPRKRMSEADIRAIGSNSRGSHILRRASEEAFLDGSLDIALRLTDHVIDATWRSSHKARAMAYQAFFLAQAGDPDAAATALSRAWNHYYEYRRGAGGKETFWTLVVQFDLALADGAISMAEGDLVRAEAKYYQALNYFDRAWDVSSGVFELPEYRQAMVQIELSRTMRLQGRLNEAEIWAREALMGDDYRIKPMALLSLSEIYYARQQFEMARQLALAARNLIIDRCVSVEALPRARARAVYAQTLMASDRWTEAADEFMAIEKEMASDPEAFNRSYRDNTDWGLAMIMVGAPKKAIEQLERAARRSARRYGSGHYNTREAQALIGVAQAAAGDAQSARSQLDSSVPDLLSKWREAEADNTSGAFRKLKLRLIVETYINLLTANGNATDIENAFAMAGALQSQAVGKSLAASAARTTVSDPALAELIRQRQDLEMRAGAFQSQITQSMQTAEGVADPAATEKLKAEMATLNGAIAALDEQVKSSFPRYAAIMHPDALTPTDLRAHLKQGEAVVAFFVGTKHTFVWAFGQTGPVSLTVADKGRSALAEDVTHLRKALDPAGVRRLKDIPEFDVAVGFALYEALLAPVAAGWQSAKSLMIIPDGPLGQLPLTVLPTSPASLPAVGDALFANYRTIPWLGRSKAVTLLPSASALVTLRTLPKGNTGRRALAAFGDPVFSKAQAAIRKPDDTLLLASRGGFHRRGIRVAEKTSLDDNSLDAVNLSMLQPLPDTADEVIGIAAALGADPRTDVFLGEKASETIVKGMPLDDRRVLVFATHGLIPGDLDGLREPALALSAAAVTGETDVDGLLTMGEVMGLSLDADWVVLSACNTAAGDGTGAEAVSGLGQAFFYAGARSLLVTGWPVETTSARALTTDLFKRQKAHPEMSRAEALKETMTALMDGPGGDGFTYAHPLFWAPYILVGDGS